jgi:hypothetical protein
MGSFNDASHTEVCHGPKKSPVLDNCNKWIENDPYEINTGLMTLDRNGILRDKVSFHGSRIVIRRKI